MKKENLNRAVQLKEKLDELISVLKAMNSHPEWGSSWVWVLEIGNRRFDVTGNLHERFKAAIEESINEINREIEGL